MLGTWGKLSRLLDRVLLIDIETSIYDSMRTKAVCVVGSIMICLQLINLVIMTASYKEWTYLQSISIVVVFVMLFSIFMLRYIKVGRLYAIFYTGMIFASIVFSAVPDKTGINTTLAPFIIVGTLIAGFISDWRVVAAYGLCSILFIWYLYFVAMGAPTTGLYNPIMYGSLIFQRAVQFSLASVLTSGIVMLFSHNIFAMFTLLEEKVQQALNAEAIKTQFLSNMSHELRNPLSGIIGVSDLLLNTNLDPTQKQYTQIVKDCGEGLIVIINDVLDTSTLDAKKLVLKSESFNMRTLTTSLISLHSPAALRTGISLDLRYPEHLPSFFIGDEGRLRQVVNNLLGNAIKFTAEGSVTLFVDGRISDDGNFGLYVAVKDTGVGIAPEDMVKVFVRFEQIDNPLSSQHKGTGLGLSIAKEIITNMGGDMDVASQINHGSVFYFNITLPIAIQTETISGTSSPVHGRVAS